MSTSKIQTVLFDLDGTFADTAPDLAQALNQTLSAHNRPNLALEQIRPVVSHGGKALIELGFAIQDTDPQFELLKQELLNYYKQDIAVHTQLFDGMEQVLEQLNHNKINWGIVTNKPSWLTNPLMDSLGFSNHACCIVSGDTLTERKPHPAPLLHAAQQCGVTADDCLYIGDAERDIVAGKRAGMRTMVANYGYILDTDNPIDWDADVYVDRPAQIYEWIDAVNNSHTDLSNKHAN